MRGSILYTHKVLRTLFYLILLSDFQHPVLAARKLPKLPITSFAVRHAWSHLLMMMPPAARLALGQGDALKSDCEKYQKEGSSIFHWEPELANCDYKLANKLFEWVFDGGNDDDSLALWLPKLDSSAETKKLEALVGIMNRNSQRLGNLQVKVSTWPATPATKLDLCWGRGSATRSDRDGSSSQKSTSLAEIEIAIQNTEQWVEKTLCGLSLCPYTSSLQKAAVGLGSAGVAEGPIAIRHSAKLLLQNDDDDDVSAELLSSAPALAHAFWQGVQELATLPEDQVATLLILAPHGYDENFLEFAAIFDELLEPSIQATGSEAIVGRALFHPTYDSKLLGHTQLLPGHALPAKMVDGFFDQYAAEESLIEEEEGKPDLESIANANDAVRWTPHATINLLRRSQLTAAKEVEAASPRKKPNWIYARNVLRILKSDPSLFSSTSSDGQTTNKQKQ